HDDAPRATEQRSRADLRLREQARRRAALERRADPRLVPPRCQDRGRRIAWGRRPKEQERQPGWRKAMNGKMMTRAYAAAAMLCGALMATAQAQEIRLAQQFSMGYLQLNVMQHQKLIEKHAATLGIP